MEPTREWKIVDGWPVPDSKGADGSPDRMLLTDFLDVTPEPSALAAHIAHRRALGLRCSHLAEPTR